MTAKHSNKFGKGRLIAYRNEHGKWLLVKVVNASKMFYFLENYVTKWDEFDGWLVRSQGLDTYKEWQNLVETTGVKVTKDNIEGLVLLYF